MILEKETSMRTNKRIVAFVVGMCIVAMSADIFGQELPPGRREIRRLDVPGAPNKQIVVEMNEFKPGEGLARHSHPGIEQGIVLQGAMMQPDGKEPFKVETGTLLQNMPDVEHGGWKIVGETSLKAFSVYVVDRDRPLYNWVK
jgi:quercetin dioxygenase-like cupin family protein